MRKTTLIWIILLFSINVYSQGKISFPFASNYDEDAQISIGIQYNFVNQNYQLQLKENWQTNYPLDYPVDANTYLGELKSISGKKGYGASVSIPVDIRIDENFYLNISPSFLFVNNLAMEYTALNEDLPPLIRKSRHILSSKNGTNFNAFEIPFSVKLRSDEKVLKNKYNRYRAYMIAGVRLTRWLDIDKEYKQLTQESEQPPHALVLKPSYLSWEAGLGADILFTHFRVSPEIKFNQSFGNVFDMKNTLANKNKFMAPIEKSLIRNIYFSLIFQ